jgi:hypothetical protein
MMHTLYIAVNWEIGGIYVGVTKNLKIRMRQHRYDATERRNRQIARFHTAIAYLGWSSFTFYNLGSFDTKREAEVAEAYWIALYRGQGAIVYNISEHGANNHGRFLRTFEGSENGFAKLKEVEVLEIRRLASIERKSYIEIAKAFGVTASNVGNIVRRKTWRHV